MLASLTRAWRNYAHERERTILAARLGPHLARDIGLHDARFARNQSALTTTGEL